MVMIMDVHTYPYGALIVQNIYWVDYFVKRSQVSPL